MDTCIRMAEFLHCSPETITTLFTGYTPIQNKNKKKKNLLSSAGDMGSLSGGETKTPHAVEQLSLHSQLPSNILSTPQ